VDETVTTKRIFPKQRRDFPQGNRFIFSIPEEVEITFNKIGLLTHASSYFKTFPDKYLLLHASLSSGPFISSAYTVAGAVSVSNRIPN
jgi:hypothetical protein